MREKIVKVRMSDEERQRAAEAAERSGHKLAAWARAVILAAAKRVDADA